MRAGADITEVKRMLSDRAEAVAAYLLPSGKREGREWCAGSIGGEPGHSLKVNVTGDRRGVWCDFAADDARGDLLDLWQAVRSMTLPEALDDTRRWLGLPTGEVRPAARKVYKTPPKPKGEAPKSKVLRYLTETRKVSAEAIKAYGVLEEDGGETMVFPCYRDGELRLVKRRAVARDANGKAKVWASGDSEPTLFGWQAIPQHAREAVITEGEIDALTGWDYGLAALSVPFGGGTGAKQQWIENDFEALARFEVIYLALDMDEPGQLAAQEIAARLGRHRCRFVQLPHKDLNDCKRAGVTRDQMAKIFGAAKTADPEELKSAAEYAESVVNLFYPPEGSREAGYFLPWTKIGNRLLFRPGELTVWQGATGSGKSQVLGHAGLSMMKQGARLCIASLEMEPGRLLQRMARQATASELPGADDIRELHDWYADRLWLVARVGKAGVEHLLDLFDYARRRYGCDVFVIDSLMRIGGIGPDDYAAQEAAAFAITSFAVENGVHVHLVCHSRKSGGTAEAGTEDIKGTSEIGANAFNAISVYKDRAVLNKRQDLEKAEAAGQLTEKQTKEIAEWRNKPDAILTVSKQRNGDWEGKVFLWFDKASYRFKSGPNEPVFSFLPFQADKTDEEFLDTYAQARARGL